MYKLTLLLMVIFSSDFALAKEPSYEDKKQICQSTIKNVANQKWMHDNFLLKQSEVVDINNDGKMDEVITSYDGTMRIQHSYFKDSNLNEITLEKATDINDEEFGDTASIISLDGINYILYCKENCKIPKYIEYISNSNETHRICDFDQTAIEENISNNKVCESFTSVNNDRYIKFTDEIKLNRTANYEWGVYLKNAGYVDIDRDGKKDHLAYAVYNSTAGRGCIYNFFELLSDDEMAIIKNGLSKVVPNEWNKELAYCDGNKTGWSEIDGKLYFENKYPGDKPEANSLFHKVFEITSSGYSEVCNFKLINKITISKIYDK